MVTWMVSSIFPLSASSSLNHHDTGDKVMDGFMTSNLSYEHLRKIRLVYFSCTTGYQLRVELQQPRRHEQAGLARVSRVRFGDAPYSCAESMSHFHRTFIDTATPLSTIRRPPDARPSAAGGTYSSFSSSQAFAAGCVDIVSRTTPTPCGIEERLVIAKVKRQRMGRDATTKARIRQLLL